MTLLDVGDVEALFKDVLEKTSSRKIEIEIGCGNGHFITQYAHRNPDRFFLGVEIKKQRCIKTLTKVEREKLQNVKIIHGHAEDFIEKIPSGTIEKIHIYFPDPWPKNRHRKRRLLRYPILEKFSRILVKGGKIYFVTDFLDYYIQTKILFIKHPCFSLSREELPQNVFDSIYAQKFISIQKPVHSLIAVKL